MAKCCSFKVAGQEMKVYPILADVLKFLQTQRLGVRHEKKLTGKDAKKLSSGEMTLDDYVNMKNESDRVKLMDEVGKESVKRIERERTREASISEDERSTSSVPMKIDRRGRWPRKKKTKEVFRCRICNSYRLRVVDYGREDNKNVLECANRKCLASIELTEKPAGTLIEAPISSGYNCGWYMDSTYNIRYPRLERIKKKELTQVPVIDDPEEGDDEVIKEIFCPGQTTKVLLM